MSKIIFKCKKCNKWSESIPEAWNDLKPKKCPKCKISFIQNPDQLLTTKPKVVSLDKDIQEVLESDAKKVFKS